MEGWEEKEGKYKEEKLHYIGGIREFGEERKNTVHSRTVIVLKSKRNIWELFSSDFVEEDFPCQKPFILIF